MIQLEIEKLKLKDLNQIDLESLKNNQVVVRIEELANDGQYEFEPMAAREFYEVMETILEKYRDQIQGTAVGQRLEIVAIKMMWQALPALDKKIKQEILNDKLLLAIENKIDVLANLDAYLYIYEYGVGPDYEERHIFGHSLDQNQERLGSNNLKLKSGQEILPYLSNWVKDYSSYTNPKSPKGVSYELTQYLYSSPNVKNLTTRQKEILAQVIRLYHHLAHPQYIPEIIGGPGSPETKPTLPTVESALRPAAPVSSFDAKLSVAATGHGASLDLLKSRLEKKTPGSEIQPSPVRSSDRTPSPRGGGGIGRGPLTPEEIEREVGTPELPASPAVLKPPLVRKEEVLPKPLVAKVQTINFAPKLVGSSIKVIDDLKKLDIAYLRAGTLEYQIPHLKSLISNLARSNNVLPYHVVLAYEQSPLFAAYLKAGTAKITNVPGSGDLTQVEFEALADLRKEIEHI